jgi:hypothetical protein
MIIARVYETNGPIYFLGSSNVDEIEEIWKIESKSDFDSINDSCHGNLSCDGSTWQDWEGVFFVHYWDGNNWKALQIDDEFEIVEYEEVEDTSPEPAFYFGKRIEVDDQSIELVTSNMSGNITPFWMSHPEYLWNTIRGA